MTLAQQKQVGSAPQLQPKTPALSQQNVHLQETYLFSRVRIVPFAVSRRSAAHGILWCC